MEYRRGRVGVEYVLWVWSVGCGCERRWVQLVIECGRISERCRVGWKCGSGYGCGVWNVWEVWVSVGVGVCRCEVVYIR